MSTLRISRRQALQVIDSATFATLTAVVGSGKASAARGWCRADPLLRIAGQYVHVYISSPNEMLQSATDKIRLIVMLPPGVAARKISIRADFGKGYDIRFVTVSTLKVVKGRVPVVFTVFCPARDSRLSVNVEFTPVGSGPLVGASSTGSANELVTAYAV
jgi:hypothetical protein